MIDDRDLGTTHVLRGSDLITASAAHIYLAGLIGAENVAQAQYVHHSLVKGPDGRKLSKSTMGNATMPRLDARAIQRVQEMARSIGEPLSIRPS